MLRDATEKGWNPLLNINEIKDIFAVDVGFSNDAKGHKNRESFHLIFMKEYSFETIRECYKVNLEIEIIKICKDLGYDFNKTNNVIDNKIFQALLTRLEALCEQLEVKIAVEKYISMNKNYTQFKINSNPILNKLCQKIIPAHHYINKRNKKYCNLIPNEWLKNEECENNHFDWSIWKEIPKKTLPNLFKKISLKLSLENIYLLYHHLVTLKVFKDEAFLQEIAAHKLNFIKPLTNMPTKLLKNGLFLVEGKTNETQKSISSSYTSRSS
jgi:hypothetical protein